MSTLDTTTDRKSLAARHRKEMIAALVDEKVRTEVARMGPDGNTALSVLPLLPAGRADYFHDCLRALPGWTLENWLIEDSGEVYTVDEAEFAAAQPERRFSQNECLRALPTDSRSLPIQALISATQSDEVRRSMSDAYGRPVCWRGMDMARYDRGQYLRRHADNWEDRVFGVIFFLAPGWRPGYGGELVVDGADGRAGVAHPEQGNVAVLKIRPGYHHQVCEVSNDSWTRCGIAVHFALDK